METRAREGNKGVVFVARHHPRYGEKVARFLNLENGPPAFRQHARAQQPRGQPCERRPARAAALAPITKVNKIGRDASPPQSKPLHQQGTAFCTGQL